MRIISPKHVVGFAATHPAAQPSLERWLRITRAAAWSSTQDVVATLPNAKVLNAERVRFEVAGGAFRLIAAFDFRRGIVYVKFIGTHAEYDRIDPFTVSQF